MGGKGSNSKPGLGADEMKLETLGSKILAGEVSSEFKPAEPFKFMTT